MGNVRNDFLQIARRLGIACIYECGSRDARDSLALVQGIGAQELHVFECNPQAVELCRRNLEAYRGPARLHFTPKAVCEQEGELDFYAIDPERTVTGWKDGNIGASSLYRADPAWPYEKYVQRTVRVSSLSLDHYCRSHRPPDLLWLDVQGAEHRVLAGAAGVLPSVKLLHVEVCFRPLYTGQSLFWQVHAMLRAQFRLVRLYGVRSRLLLRLNTRLNREKWFTDAVYINRRNDIPALRYSSRGFD
jgi:FkbM family methyltransferase